jgi:type II secretory pathway predicted ATPase ExeA
VKLSIDGIHGTGFFVAAGLILTCHHVVKNAGDRPIKVRWQNQEDFAMATVLQSFPDPAVDLALLQFETVETLACVELDGAIAAFDDLFAYGYPDIDPNGAGVVLRCDGLNGDVPPKIKFSDGRVRSGLSGAPLLNPATGKVCGVVKYTEDRSLPLGGGGIPIATVFEYFPDLVTLHSQFHQQQNKNPFEGQASVEALSYHIGREDLIRQIFEELEKGANRSLIGDSRVGKTWLLKQICQRGKDKIKRKIEGFIYLDLRCMEDGKDFFEALCLELRIDPPIRGSKLSRALKGKQYVLCLDEIDQLTDDLRFTKIERDQLYSLCDGKDMPFSLLITSQVPLNLLFPDLPHRSSPLVGICQQIDVNPVSISQIRSFVSQRLEDTGICFNESIIQELYKDCKGRPELLLEQAAKKYEEIIKNI